MPPPNSTAQSPTVSPHASSPYLHQLELLSSPPPDLAATLTNPADALADHDSLNMLTTPLQGDGDSPASGERSTPVDIGENARWGEWDRRLSRLRSLELAMSRRVPTRPEDEGASYANRVPQRQSLYDWAPGSDDEELYHEILSRANIPTFARSARTPSRHLHFEHHRRSHSRLRTHPRDGDTGRLTSWNEAIGRDGSPHRPEPSSSTAALLQSVEQHRRSNTRPRSTLQSYILERDRRNNEPTPSASTWARLHRSENQPPGSPYPAIRTLSSQADLQNAYPQLSLENASMSRLKNSIRYLAKLRQCDTLEEGLTLAADLAVDDSCLRGRATSLHRFIKLSDLIVNTSSLPPVAECAWLTPGTVFKGSQHTPRETPPGMLYRDSEFGREPPSRIARHQHDPQHLLQERHRRRSHARLGSYRDRLPVPDITFRHHAMPPLVSSSNQPSGTGSDHHHQPSTSASPPPSDHWPVTIVLHDISLSPTGTQTLCGTMSATHIPDKFSPHSPHHKPQGSSMRSFFEGEIIDFKTHTLQTENFSTAEEGDEPYGMGGVATDARYWRSIGPFRELLEKERKERAKVKDGKFGGRGWAGRHVGGDGLGGVGGSSDEEEEEDDDDGRVEDALGGEDIIASHLRSRSWIENVLLKDWVLMRWKERCFINDDSTVTDSIASSSSSSLTRRTTTRDGATFPRATTATIAGRTGTETGTRIAGGRRRGSGGGGGGGRGGGGGGGGDTDPCSWGLTISGFYYVALRRQTGEMEGLYYDPGSLPFQVLELRPEGLGGGNNATPKAVATESGVGDRDGEKEEDRGNRGDREERAPRTTICRGVKTRWPALGFR